MDRLTEALVAARHFMRNARSAAAAGLMAKPIDLVAKVKNAIQEAKANARRPADQLFLSAPYVIDGVTLMDCWHALRTAGYITQSGELDVWNGSQADLKRLIHGRFGFNDWSGLAGSVTVRGKHINPRSIAAQQPSYDDNSESWLEIEQFLETKANLPLRSPPHPG
jgi:hypothetical protein